MTFPWKQAREEAPALKYARAQPLLGSLVEIAAWGREYGLVQMAVDQAFCAVEEVQRRMSYHDPDSDVSRINRLAAREPVPVSLHTWRVLRAAREFSRASDGIFDITIAPTLAAMGFLPRHGDFPRASGQGDWRHVELCDGRRVSLARRVRIDLGGIAKGYAVDYAVRLLKASGMCAARVNAGGDLRLFGAEAQTILVRHPTSPTRLLPLIKLAEGAVATSAGYFSDRRYQGKRVSALIHPRTRAPCPCGSSVSVLARDCMTADALTKVIHVDPQQAAVILPRFRARAWVLAHDDSTGLCKQYDSMGARTQAWQVQWRPGAWHA